MAGLDTLISGETDYPTEVKANELGMNLILGGHQQTEVFGVKNLGCKIRDKIMKARIG
jgi:putative NIF3 family GTP cyclohydrolase 1 type 2